MFIACTGDEDCSGDRICEDNGEGTGLVCCQPFEGKTEEPLIPKKIRRFGGFYTIITSYYQTFPGCKIDSDCIHGRICRKSVCVKPPEKYECVLNEDCRSGKNCVNGYCVNLCRKDEDCKAPNICKIHAYPATCTSPSDGRQCNSLIKVLYIVNDNCKVIPIHAIVLIQYLWRCHGAIDSAVGH